LSPQSAAVAFDTIRPEILRVQQSIERHFRGKTERVQLALITMLARGHLLLEDVPGVGKTTLAHLLAASIDCPFQRVQFTSDLLPSDVLGVTIYNRESGEFEFKQGPIFTNVLLADEINRSTPKTQSCLLEAMSAEAVSIENRTYPLPHPFVVIATQNPIEVHGTFPLPQSQLDRFMMRLTMGYPDRDSELALLREQKKAIDFAAIKPILHSEEVVQFQDAVTEVRMTDEVLDYLARAVDATRSAPDIELGVSTRGAMSLRNAAKARAWYFGRDYVVPDDVKLLAPYVMGHRLQMVQTFDGGGSGWARGERQDEAAVRRLLERIAVPV